MVGTKGRVIARRRFHHPTALRIERLGQEPEVVQNDLVGKGYSHELAHVGECLAEGLTESPVMPLDDTLATMRILDEALSQLDAPHVDEGFSEATRCA